MYMYPSSHTTILVGLLDLEEILQIPRNTCLTYSNNPEDVNLQ
jgi:hypothetical protein